MYYIKQNVHKALHNDYESVCYILTILWMWLLTCYQQCEWDFYLVANRVNEVVNVLQTYRMSLKTDWKQRE